MRRLHSRQENYGKGVYNRLMTGEIFDAETALGIGMLAVPMIILYFGGMYFARRTERKNFVDQSEGVSESL